MNMKIVTLIALLFGIIAVVGISSASDDTDAAVVDPSTGTQVGDLYYTFSGTDATVVGISSSLSSATSITIPDTVESDGTTYNVTAIYSPTDYTKGVFADLTSLESVTFSQNLTTIGNYAFNGCTNLEQISLPDSVEYIGNAAFYNCSALALTELPSGLETIGISAFYNCSALAISDLPDDLSSLGAGAFGICTSLESLSIPILITDINSTTFDGCTNLTFSIDVSVTAGTETTTESWVTGKDAALPTCVVTLPSSAANIFLTNWTYGSTDYAIGDSVTMTLANRNITANIDPATYGTCGDDLDWILYTDYTLSITGTGATYNYGVIGNNVPWYPYKSSIVNVELPEGLTSVGDFTFGDCTAITVIEIPETVTAIGNGAFNGCRSLSSANLPEGITSIGNNAFFGSALENLVLPGTLITIGTGAFYGCPATGVLTLPESVVSVGINAFSNCSGYTAVVVEGSPTFDTNSLNMANVSEVLNLGSTELSAGSYGLPADAEVRSDIPLMGYIAPTSVTKTEQKEGEIYDLLAVIPILIIAAILLSVATMIITRRD